MEKNGKIDVWSDRCPLFYGYHFSNTASFEENPQGERPVALYLNGKKNVTIDGNGCEISVHGIMTPFLFDSCENLTLKNIRFDYARPTMSEFDIVEKSSDGVYKLSFLSESLFEVKGNRLIWHGEIGKNGEYLWASDYRDSMNIAMYRDPKTEYVKMMPREHGLRFPCIPEFDFIETVGESVLNVTLKRKDAFFPVGCRIQTRNTIRDQIGGCFMHCKNVRFENSSVFAIHGFGILAQFCENVLYDKITIVPINSRTIASNADFFQMSGCKGKVIIKRCKLIGGHDDYINIHGTYLKVVERGVRELIVRFCNPNSRGFAAFFVGDEIEFVSSSTLIPYGRAIVLDAKKLGDKEISLKLDRECFVEIGDSVENVTWTPSVEIRDNMFGASMGRGVLCTTRKKAVVENNFFYKLGGSALCIEDDCNFWFESGNVGEMVFRNNTVIDCGYGFGENNEPIVSCCPQVAASGEGIYPHEKLVIENNLFQKLPKDSYRVDICHTKTFIYKNNISDSEIRLRLEQVKNVIK